MKRVFVFVFIIIILLITIAEQFNKQIDTIVIDDNLENKE